MTGPRRRGRDRRDAVVTPLISGSLAAAPGMYAATGSALAVLLLLVTAAGIVAALIGRR